MYIIRFKKAIGEIPKDALGFFREGSKNFMNVIAKLYNCFKHSKPKKVVPLCVKCRVKKCPDNPKFKNMKENYD